jgi:dihydrofolate reductase
MEAIVAVYEDWGIGANGTQQVVIPEDRKRFQQLTEGHAIIVGRKTLEDFPGGKPLKNRRNYVLTRQNIEIEGATVCHSVEETLEAVKDEPRVFVVGGQSVFHEFMRYCSRVHITRIYTRPQSDSFFNNLDEDFNWICEEFSDPMFYEGIKYRFCEYEVYDITKNISKA